VAGVKYDPGRLYLIGKSGEILDRLEGAKYFSSIDLGNAYYQVELEEYKYIKN